MMILSYSGRSWVLKSVIKSFPALSGVRCLYKSDFNLIRFADSDCFEMEVRINDHYLKNNLEIGWIEGNGVTTPLKYIKYGYVYGNWLEIWAFIEVIFANGWIGFWGILKQWRQISEMKVEVLLHT